MNDHRFKTYIYWGITAISVIAVSIALIFLMLNINKVKYGVEEIAAILAPVIYGAILAYLTAPVYNQCVNISKKQLSSVMKNEKYIISISKMFATIISFLLVVAVVVGLIWMLLPQLISSITGVIETLPGNLENLSKLLQKVLADNPDMEITVMSGYDKVVSMFQDWLNSDLMPNLNIVISGVSNGVITLIVLLKNILIGLIVMVYLLNIKATFTAQGKKAVYSIFSINLANKIITKLRFVNKVFGGFIIGKLLDSLIIGIICFVCLSIMKMPYVLLVSVIIGVTNIIPFFGPFIGAVPSAVLILLVSPMQCLYFMIFILLLQQFDGNILGPKILGNSTGLPSFWVLFSILLFGGIFGFVGMIIAVPTFAVIYSIIAEGIAASLKKKDLPSNTKDYIGLNLIDDEKKIL